MALLADEKNFIDTNETKYRAAVSEATAQKMGKMMNFIGHRSHEIKEFFINGRYGGASAQNGLDGLAIFQFDAEIFNIYIFGNVQGSGGTTELDIKHASDPGGAFTSIFSTTPKITSSASNFSWIGIGDTVSGCTAPVLTSSPDSYEVSAGDAIRIDLISAQTGNAENCGIIVHYRPI